MNTRRQSITRLSGAACALSLLALAGCGSGNWNVSRNDPNEVKDLNYRFDEDDARQVFQQMVNDCLSKPWIDNWRAEKGERPIVVVSTIRNNTQEYINSNIFTSQVERELINSGRVRFKERKDRRDVIRDERLDVKYNDPSTVKAVAKELNADFVMVGEINDNKETTRDGRSVIQFYQVNMEMVNAETAEKVWIGTKEIEKRAKR